jgi:hypothetical protein
MPTKKVDKKVVPTKVTAKKVVKKSVKPATKKLPAKKATRKTELIYADNTKSFWVTDGKILNSLLALRDALDEMHQETYQYHANKVNNDFANWVADVLADKQCALELKKATTPKSAKTVVIKYLKLYNV